MIAKFCNNKFNALRGCDKPLRQSELPKNRFGWQFFLALQKDFSLMHMNFL